MTLGERLDRLRAERSAVGELHEPYEATIRELDRTGFLDSALRPGNIFPDFLMPHAEGRLISSDEVLAKGPMVVTFFRGDWCPYCRVMLDSLQENVPGIVAEGGSLVAVTPDSGGIPLETKRNHHAGYEILSDLDNGLGLQCGVVFRLPEPYRRLLKGWSLRETRYGS